MPEPPVSRNSPNTLKSRVVPIILVPGIMGTRLSFENSEVTWDPDHPYLEMRHWLSMSANEKSDLLNVETTKAKVIDEDVARGWTTIAGPIYKKVLDALDSFDFAGADTPVYAIGYDWRQSCAVSGAYLAVKINRVLEVEKAKKVILITHSMGGLVARSAMRRSSGLPGKVLGAIHVAQPVAGSVALYRRLFTGVLADWDAGGNENLAKILGVTPLEFIVPMRGAPGVFELLPTHQYRYVPDDLPDDSVVNLLHGPWESSEKGTVDSQGRTVYPHGITQRYLDEEDGPPGLFNKKMHSSKNRADTKKTKALVVQNAKGADGFHEALGLYSHPNTFAVYSTGLETDVAVRYPLKQLKKPHDVAYRLPLGDGTVPAASAAALFSVSIAGTEKNAKSDNNRQFFVNGAVHSDILDHSDVRKVLFQLVYQMIKRS